MDDFYQTCTDTRRTAYCELRADYGLRTYFELRAHYELIANCGLKADPRRWALQPCTGAELLDPIESIQRQEVSYGRSTEGAGRVAGFERKKGWTKKIRGT
jgi:hypothetical protein